MTRPRHVTAQMIWDDLVAHGDSSTWQIRGRTGLSHMQYWYGMGYLKDVLQTQNGQPLVWSPRRGVYSLTTSEGEWHDYLILFRMRSVATQLYRMEMNAKAGGQLFGTRKKGIRLMIAGIEGLRKQAEAML